MSSSFIEYESLFVHWFSMYRRNILWALFILTLEKSVDYEPTRAIWAGFEKRFSIECTKIPFYEWKAQVKNER